MKSVVGRERPAGLPVGAVLHEGAVGGVGFISGHAAVAAALATAAAPYLGRRGRRTVWALAWAVALARVYVGAHLPLDIVGGVAAGLGGRLAGALGVRRAALGTVGPAGSPSCCAASGCRCATCARPTSRPAARIRSRRSTTPAAAAT